MESRVDTRTLRHIFERGDTIVLHLSWDGDKKKRYRVSHLETARTCMDNPRRLLRKGLGRPRRALLYAIEKKNNGHRRHVLGEYVEPATLSGGGEFELWTKADDSNHITSNYKVVRVNNNGDCIFAAVALAHEFIFLTTKDIEERIDWHMDGDDLQKATDTLRSLANSAVCDENGEIKEIYQASKDVGWRNGNGLFIESSDKEYCERLGTTAIKARNDKNWPEGAVFGTHVELDAMSRIIDRPIYVYKYEQPDDISQGMTIHTHFPMYTDNYGDTVDLRVKEPVRIIFHNMHYDAMVRKDSAHAHASVDEKKQCNICTFLNEANATQCTLCHHVFGDT